MKIAVVGGGLFGSTAAITLAREGHIVHLYERAARLMTGASMVNQFRFHEGYHYPRSAETVEELRQSKEAFIAEYGDAVIADNTHFYAVAKQGSQTSMLAYEAFMTEQDLPFRRIDLSFMAAEKIAALYQVEEDYICYQTLFKLVTERLIEERVTIFTSHEIDCRLRDKYDHIVLACYAGNNQAAMTLGLMPVETKFEVVEKPVIRLPGRMWGVGVVVMDGEFFSVDPYGSTDMHLFGHVRDAIWTSYTGEVPKIPRALRDYVNRVVRHPNYTRFKMMRDDAAKYLPLMAKAEHVSSMYTVRAVLPDVEASDARPTIVTRLDDQVTQIFSGKLTLAVQAARQILECVEISAQSATSRHSRDRRR